MLLTEFTTMSCLGYKRPVSARLCSFRQASIYLRFVCMFINSRIFISCFCFALNRHTAIRQDERTWMGLCPSQLSGTRYPWQAWCLSWEPKRKNTSAATNHLPSTTPMLDASFSPKHSMCWVSLRLCSLIWHHRNVDTSDSQPRPLSSHLNYILLVLSTEEPTQVSISSPWSISLSSVWARSQSPTYIFPLFASSSL